MEGDEPYLPPEPATFSANSTFKRPVNPDCTTSTTSSSSSSPNAFLNNFIAAFKRHRPLGMNNIKPRRMFVPQQETPKSSTCVTKSKFNGKRAEEDCISEPKNNMVPDAAEHASMILPSTMNTYEESSNQFADCKNNNDTVASSIGEHRLEGSKKVHFATQSDARFQEADKPVATGLDSIISHLDTLAFTEMEWDRSNQIDVPTVGHDLPHQSTVSDGVDKFMRARGGTSLLADMGVSDQLHKFSNFIHNYASQPITQSSVVGLSCATTTLINAGSAPKLSSTTYCSEPQLETDSKLTVGRVGNTEIIYQSTEEPGMLPLDPPLNCKNDLRQQLATGGKVQSSTSKAGLQVESSTLSNEKGILISKDSGNALNPPPPLGNSAAIDIQKGFQSEAPLSHVSETKLESNKLGKQGKSVGGKAASISCKKTYDADLFFKVNGKLYQRLGKIGSGGSSEVYKVISSNCTIYALKKIKLKGRDYATAFGFCQEIQYLNKLKGKHNIIQLVDFEVTDKALLEEVINGSMSNEDGRVKEDGYIYMVLEYGEIDLAHMLSQEWKGLDDSNLTIDQNWLRYYWQQILQAVNTIHEERIVHSDLKPANFLLVRGSLKLIDFGIAKAIMSDTTNIQRDSQVGTLSYMSPEAFLCNEKDANGNTIKCGRPSDIWSLGCILYQMVYGRTPFSDYKTFLAKFKVITNPNHKIEYGPVSNPWLKDLMEKCLAWDRNERWRIPQLLEHPFLVPPIPPPVSMPNDQSCKLVNLISQSCKGDPTTLTLCAQLERLLKDPKPAIHQSLGELQRLFLGMSNQCLELQKQMSKVEGL